MCYFFKMFNFISILFPGNRLTHNIAILTQQNVWTVGGVGVRVL